MYWCIYFPSLFSLCVPERAPYYYIHLAVTYTNVTLATHCQRQMYILRFHVLLLLLPHVETTEQRGRARAFCMYYIGVQCYVQASEYIYIICIPIALHMANVPHIMYQKYVTFTTRIQACRAFQHFPVRQTDAVEAECVSM